jgi:hypothetical protein
MNIIGMGTRMAGMVQSRIATCIDMLRSATAIRIFRISIIGMTTS